MKPLANLCDVVGVVPPSGSVVLHSACAEPRLLAAQLAHNAHALHDVTLYTLMPMGATPYADTAASSHLSVTTFFPGKGLRDAVTGGRATLWRTPLSAIPELFRSGVLRADVLLLQLSPPDASGNMSLGISVDYMRAVLEQDPLVIAEINPLMPFTSGDTLVSADQVDYFVESANPLQTVLPASADATDRQIAGHVAGLIRNGAALQVGIGLLPDLVLEQLGHLHDLSIHGGIITDAVLPLIECGTINGKCITTMAAGTQPFYHALHGNLAVEFHPCSVTHDLETLAKIPHLHAINSVLQIDLSGHANAERVDGKSISGPGGLPDFARGATLSRGGVSIAALRAASKDGRRSNIVGELPPNSPTTISAEDIGYVVTEYGVARLGGCDSVARSRALIAVAHPDFREELRRYGSAGHAAARSGVQ